MRIENKPISSKYKYENIMSAFLLQFVQFKGELWLNPQQRITHL